MSDPIFPNAVWSPGTMQNATPANTNSLRDEARSRLVISKATTAQPGSPADGDVYIIPAGATGAQWAGFTEHDLAIYRSGTWYAYAPVAGLVVNVAGALEQFETGTGWVAAGSSTPVPYFSPVVTESGTTRTLEQADAGTYIRFTNASAKALVISADAVEPIDADSEFHGRNAGAGVLTISPETGVTVNPPADGTLEVPEGGTFTLKQVATDEFDLIGVTVPA